MKNIFNIYRDFYAKSKFLILGFVFLSMVCNIIIIVIPIINARIIDSAVYFEGLNIFFKFVIWGILIHVIFSFIMPYFNYLALKIKTDATTELRKKIISRIPLLHFEIKKQTSIGHILQLVNDDLENTSSLVMSDFIDFLCQVVYFIAILYIVLKINITLALLLFTISLPLVIVSKIMIPKIQKMYRESIENNEEVKNITESVYSGSLAIKLVNAYEVINKKINTIVSAQYKTLMKYNKITVIHYHFFTASTMNVGRVAVIILGAYMIIQGNVSVGSLTLLTTYFGGLWGTYSFFFGFWASFKEKMVSIDRIVSFFNLPIESSDGELFNEFASMVMSDVSYSIDEKNILSNICFTIKRGDKVLISGDNGSGKSTLVRLLVGLMSPSSGSIVYNGTELSNYNLHSLRKRVCFIPAEPYVFFGSLEDNFYTYGLSSALIDEKKYQSIAKEGSNLSSGEKKRLQLATGMQQHCDIYILDEPLNFVDDVSKKEIVEIIKKEFSEKTLIVISHDSNQFDFFKDKYVMESGILRKL